MITKPQEMMNGSALPKNLKMLDAPKKMPPSTKMTARHYSRFYKKIKTKSRQSLRRKLASTCIPP